MAKHGIDVDATDLAPTGEELTAAAPRHSFFIRLYTGTGAFDVIGKRKMWYAISGLIVLIGIISIVVRGFTLGIDFEGGNVISLPAAGTGGTVSTERIEDVFSKAIGKAPESVIVVGSGDSASVQIRSEKLDNSQLENLRTQLFDAFHPKGSDGQPSKQAISDSAVSSTWGGQITQKALIALVVFLVLAAVYITVRYERYMAMSALATLVFDLLTTAGVYSLVGFEVTPATVIGLLTILGFSLYDTVIVFDKVEENTHGFEHTTRRTFAEQASDQPDVHAVDQHQPHLGVADHFAHGRGRVAARRRHSDGPGARPARRRDRRYLFVDLLRDPVAGDPARAHRPRPGPHSSREQPTQGGSETQWRTAAIGFRRRAGCRVDADGPRRGARQAGTRSEAHPSDRSAIG
jgi:preprotein translocase SecF subunit